MKETSLAYAAGLIDADGSLYISKSIRKDGYTSYDPILMLRSTSIETIKWFVDKFGGTYDKTSWDNDKWKDYYRWRHTSDLHASRFLDKILPYIWLKKEQALLLKEYYSMNGIQNKDKREVLYHSISKLNQNLSVTTNTSRLPLIANIKQAYLAGMFDGEGSAYIMRVKQSVQSRCKNYYYRACVEFGNTFKQVVDEFFYSYGGFFRERPPHNGMLTMYSWDIKDNKGKEKFILSILPYLVTKREQANLVLNFSRLQGKPNPELRKEMWLKCCELNGNKRESELYGDVESALPVMATA